MFQFLSLDTMPAPECTCKPRPKPKPYDRKPRAPKAKDTHATSAKLVQDNKRKNLTLGDWMTVFTYVERHPDMGQGDIVEYFKTQREGALIFTQSTLSQKLWDMEQLKDHTQSNPNALSSKRPRVVTRPDVERALMLWFRHMEEKGETVNGPMLWEKRHRFEEKFSVPENERL